MKCEICLENDASHTCRLCSRAVCDADYLRSKEICVSCDESLCEICGKNLSVGYCSICGRLVCDLCSLRKNAARICDECLSRLKSDNVLFPEK
ncbi:MAG: hypothetical protein DRJ41_04075 [Thermoprotei archaeon]|nr:MAG: hypothetical protein DRJ41_04075 [Thermoprotei archaeon]